MIQVFPCILPNIETLLKYLYTINMTYKYNIKSNPKLLFPYVIVAVVLVGAFSTFFYLSRLFAFLLSAIAVWFSYKILRSMKTLLSSRIESYTEGFNVFLSDGTKLEFEYDLITHAGLITNNDSVFVYEESKDSIVQLPPVFSDFQLFIQELKENTNCYKDYTLEEGQTIIDWLKIELGITNDDEESSESEEIDEKNDIEIEKKDDDSLSLESQAENSEER